MGRNSLTRASSDFGTIVTPTTFGGIQNQVDVAEGTIVGYQHAYVTAPASIVQTSTLNITEYSSIGAVILEKTFEFTIAAPTPGNIKVAELDPYYVFDPSDGYMLDTELVDAGFSARVTAYDSVGRVATITAGTGTSIFVVVTGAGLSVTHADSAQRLVTVRDGYYDEEVVLPAGVGLQGIGDVYVTKITTEDENYLDGIRYGTLVGNPLRAPIDDLIVERSLSGYASPTTMTVLEAIPTGHIKPMGRIDTRTNLDRPLEGRIRYSDRKGFACIVVDDADASYSTTQYAELDEVGCSHAGTDPTALEYLKFKGIAITWAPIGSSMDGAGAQQTHFAAMRDHILNRGGEIANHTFSHSSGSPPATDLEAITETQYNKALLEGLDATTVLPATGLHLSMRGSIYSGGSPQGCDPATLSGALTRACFAYHRKSGGGTKISWHTVPITPEVRYDWDHYAFGTNVAISVANQTAAVDDMLGILEHSQGIIWSVYLHAVQADNGTSTYNIRVSVWKKMIDTLAALRNAGVIEVLPVSELFLTHPTYRTNMIVNGHFEYATIPTTANWAQSCNVPYNVGGVGTAAIAAESGNVTERPHVLTLTRGTSNLMFRYEYIPSVPGGTYHLSFDCKKSGVVATVLYYQIYTDSSYANLISTGYCTPPDAWPSAGTGPSVHHEFAMPREAGQIFIKFTVTDAEGSAVMIDDVWLT